jgi:hypothetical protein
LNSVTAHAGSAAAANPAPVTRRITLRPTGDAFSFDASGMPETVAGILPLSIQDDARRSTIEGRFQVNGTFRTLERANESKAG